MRDSDVIIRKERQEDFRRTEEVAREAFWNLYVPGASEHYLIHRMRTHEDYLAELSFVAEVDGQVEGGIFYTRSGIVTAHGRVPTVSFGPVFVAPRLQKQGLGRMLISRSLRHAQVMGFSAVLLLGHPQHYAPYGFCGGRTYGICMPDGKYYVGLLALPLREHALDDCRGHAGFSPVLYAEEKDVQAFDATFSPREKRVLPSQREYERICAMLDE